MIRILRYLALAFLAVLPMVPAAGQEGQGEQLRFIMVTHGAASSSFWASIKEGAEAAAKEAGVELVYRAPETFNLEQMAALITGAVEEAPDGLIVSIPSSDAVAAPIKSAVEAGIPVISINSGYDVARSLGSLLHIGQSEYEAGRVAGEAMRSAGGTKALCLNHELGNVALDLRCKGFIDGFVGSVEVVPIDDDPESVKTLVTDRLAEDEGIDVILALNATIAGEPAIEAAKATSGRDIQVATFDLSEAVLSAVGDGAATFAIDQQPFLQGYLPVQYLALLNRRNVIPVSNVSTGPKLVEAEEARRRLGRSEAGAAEDEAGEGAEENGPEGAAENQGEGGSAAEEPTPDVEPSPQGG
jgi:simple sugar transport system substrate-binding protein